MLPAQVIRSGAALAGTELHFKGGFNPLLNPESVSFIIWGSSILNNARSTAVCRVLTLYLLYLIPFLLPITAPICDVHAPSSAAGGAIMSSIYDKGHSGFLRGTNVMYVCDLLY